MFKVAYDKKLNLLIGLFNIIDGLIAICTLGFVYSSLGLEVTWRYQLRKAKQEGSVNIHQHKK